MNKILFRFLFVITCTFYLTAAPLMRLPVKDVEEVATDMIDRAGSINAGVWSDSQVNLGGQETHRTSRNLGVGIDGLSTAVANMNFKIVVANTNDVLHSYVNVQDGDDETIMYANGERKIVSAGIAGVYWGEPLHMVFSFVYDPSIKVPDVRSAVAYLLNEKTGQTEREVRLNVSDDDLVTIPKALIGKALFEIKYDDGTVVLYGADGNRYKSGTVFSSVTVGMRNGVVVKNGDVEIFNIESYSGHGDNKFVHLVLDKEREVGFEFQTTERINATGIKYRQAGRDHINDPWLEANFENGRDGVMTLEAGNWYVVPVWDKGFSPWPRTYYPPDDDNIGKGNVIPPADTAAASK